MASGRRGSTGCTKADRDNSIMEEKNKFVRAGADVGRQKQVQVFFGSFSCLVFVMRKGGTRENSPRAASKRMPYMNQTSGVSARGSIMKREMTVKKNQKPERRRANSGQCNPASPIPERNERTRKRNGGHQAMREKSFSLPNRIQRGLVREEISGHPRRCNRAAHMIQAHEPRRARKD